MKNSTFLIIILALALVVVSYKWISATVAPEESPVSASNAAIENIMTRTSIRSYSDKKVTAEQIDTLLHAAMAAPTAANKQPWRFVVIDDRELLDSIGDNFHTMAMAKSASVAVVMCGDLKATLEGEGRDFWMQDVSAASENLLLAAHAMRLGAVWCGIYPESERVSRFSGMLNLPPEVIPMACICVGYPLGESTPKDKWKPEYVHYNSWGKSKAK